MSIYNWRNFKFGDGKLGRPNSDLLRNLPVDSAVGTFVGAPMTKLFWDDRKAYYVNRILEEDDIGPTIVELVRPFVKCINYRREEWYIESFGSCMNNIKKRRKVIVRALDDGWFVEKNNPDGAPYVVGILDERISICWEF